MRAIARIPRASDCRRSRGSARSPRAPWWQASGDATVFHNGRQFAAWLGLVPRQRSSGGKTNLLGISKRGDTYLRTLLIHGARSVLVSLKRDPVKANGWLAGVADRRNPTIAAVALANKNARTVWALLAHGRDYQGSYRAANTMTA